MAAKKKKTTPVKRKPNKAVPARNVICEYEGWSAADRCYVLFAGESKPTLCDVVQFHPKDTITPAVTVIETTTGKSRVAAVRAIADNAKDAKTTGEAWRKWYDTYRKKQLKLVKAEQKKKRAEQKKIEEAEEEARKAAELEAQEEETRILKEKNNAK